MNASNNLLTIVRKCACAAVILIPTFTNSFAADSTPFYRFWRGYPKDLSNLANSLVSIQDELFPSVEELKYNDAKLRSYMPVILKDALI